MRFPCPAGAQEGPPPPRFLLPLLRLREISSQAARRGRSPGCGTCRAAERSLSPARLREQTRTPAWRSRPSPRPASPSRCRRPAPSRSRRPSLRRARPPDRTPSPLPWSFATQAAQVYGSTLSLPLRSLQREALVRPSQPLLLPPRAPCSPEEAPPASPGDTTSPAAEPCPSPARRPALRRTRKERSTPHR